MLQTRLLDYGLRPSSWLRWLVANRAYSFLVQVL